eukprot:sb/3477151/
MLGRSIGILVISDAAGGILVISGARDRDISSIQHGISLIRDWEVYRFVTKETSHSLCNKGKMGNHWLPLLLQLNTHLSEMGEWWWVFSSPPTQYFHYSDLIGIARMRRIV